MLITRVIILTTHGTLYNLRNYTFSQRCCWGFRPSGTTLLRNVRNQSPTKHNIQKHPHLSLTIFRLH